MRGEALRRERGQHARLQGDIHRHMHPRRGDSVEKRAREVEMRRAIDATLEVDDDPLALGF